MWHQQFSHVEDVTYTESYVYQSLICFACIRIIHFLMFPLRKNARRALGNFFREKGERLEDRILVRARR